MSYKKRTFEITESYKAWVSNLETAMFDTSLIFKTKGLPPPKNKLGGKTGGTNRALKN